MRTASLRDREGLPRFVEQEFRDFLRCGCLVGDADDEGPASDAWAHEAPGLAGLAAASVQGTVALGSHPGVRLRRMGDPPEEGAAPAAGGCQARANSFDLHAGLVVPAGHRDRLERVCRYALRPPVTEDRLNLSNEGQVRLQLRQPWRDGTTDVVFDPVEFLGRLACTRATTAHQPHSVPRRAGAPGGLAV